FMSDAGNAQYGTYTITQSGHWQYGLDTLNSAVAALHAGDTLTDTIQLQAVDGTLKDVVITINGANDSPSASDDFISVKHTGSSWYETGILLSTDTDVENDVMHVHKVDGSLASHHNFTFTTSYGWFTVTDSGSFIYELNTSGNAYLHLSAGQHHNVSHSYSVT